MTKGNLKLVTSTSKPAKVGPTPPRGLAKAARAEWLRLHPLLRAKGTLTDENLPLFTAYCSNVALVAEIDRELAKAKMVIKGAGGVPRSHPLIGARNKAAATCLQLGKRLGVLGNGTTVPGKGGGRDAYSDLGI